MTLIFDLKIWLKINAHPLLKSLRSFGKALSEIEGENKNNKHMVWIMILNIGLLGP